jgi:hypothetical protein
MLNIGCLALMLFFSKTGFTTGYYVSPKGNDLHRGTKDEPFLTISKGISKLGAGDTLFVFEGIYVETIYVGQSGSISSPVTIMAYPGDVPVIDGEDILPANDGEDLVLIEGDYVHLSGFEVRNSNINGNRKGGGGVMLQGEYTRASKLNVHHIWEHGIIAKGNYSTVEECTVWECASSNKKTPGSPDAGYWSTGISAGRSPVDGITRNAVLRGNICFNNWGEGLSSFEADGVLIEDNITFDNWSVNLYVSDTRNALVQRNLIYNTYGNAVGQRRPMTLGDELADKPRSANNIIVNNILYNADLWAFWSTVVPGSGLENVIIANNTIINGQLEIGASSEDQVENVSALVCNNIFMNEMELPWEVMGPLSNITFLNNLWSVEPPIALRASGDITGNPDITEEGSTLFGELTGTYFKLRHTSPAIDKGVQLEEVMDDYFKTKRKGNPDMGAHEYNEVTGFLFPSHKEHVIKPMVAVTQTQMIINQSESEVYEDMIIYTSAGIPVLHHRISGPVFSLNVSSFSSDVYILAFKKEDRQICIKLIIP